MKAGREGSALLKERVRSLARLLDPVERGDERALHRARVTTRRLRELVPILQLNAGTARKLTRRLRKITRRLGRVRELDVLLLLIDEMHVARPTHRGSLRRVRQMVARVRDAERRALVERGLVAGMRKLVRRLERTVEDLTAKPAAAERARAARPRAAAWAVDARIAHRSARLAAAMDEAAAVYLPDRLHDVRVAVKKLRYAVELGTGDSSDRARALTTLKRVQALLGRMHDLQVLIDWVRSAQATLSPPNLMIWREMDALVLALDDACRRLHARYVHERDSLRAAGGRLQQPLRAARGPERRAG